MKKLVFTIKFCFLFFVCLCFSNCKKSNGGLNVILYNKPLSVIQEYIQGKWMLQYAKGGFCGTCISHVKNNPYMLINSNRIIFGNDSTGVVLDTTIYWIKERDIFHPLDSTFLLTYYYPPGAGPFAIAYVVDGIYNDTLKLIDDAYDPLSYYYIK